MLTFPPRIATVTDPAASPTREELNNHTLGVAQQTLAEFEAAGIRMSASPTNSSVAASADQHPNWNAISRISDASQG